LTEPPGVPASGGSPFHPCRFNMQPLGCASGGRRYYATTRLHVTCTGKGSEMTATVSTTGTDRIEKRVTLRAPQARVWRALTDAREFGAWFGARFEGAFVEGAKAIGAITIKGYEHVQLEMQVERIQPEKLFSYRWHPYAIDPKVDYSAEPTTLV